jgi:tRNA-splicing endonuclease subunit Sen34
MQMGREERVKFLREMDERGLERAMESRNRLEERSRKALKKKRLKVREEDAEKGISPEPGAASGERIEWAGKEGRPEREDGVPEDSEFLFDQPPTTVVAPPNKKLDKHFITPATSYPPLSPPSSPPTTTSSASNPALPVVPRSYPLFRYMHSHGYFSMPGLRFGCHYSIYPGDPLRFHSHFLATGLGWDEEFQLLDIVGGGRLGTGVKKAYLIGGEDTALRGSASREGSVEGTAEDGETVRPFCIEWAGF